MNYSWNYGIMNIHHNIYHNIAFNTITKKLRASIMTFDGKLQSYEYG
jgi:hypothetical protein